MSVTFDWDGLHDVVESELKGFDMMTPKEKLEWQRNFDPYYEPRAFDARAHRANRRKVRGVHL